MNWKYRGFKGPGEAPPVLGQNEGKTLLVIGSGRCAWSDLTEFLKPGEVKIQRRLYEWADSEDNDVMAVNVVGCLLHCKVRHWTSLHANYLHHWVKFRRGQRFPPEKVITHSYQEGTGVDIVWTIENTNGLSGLFGACVGVVLGYDRVIMAGCPMDNSGRFYDPPDQDCIYGRREQVSAWRQAVGQNDEIRNRVRSLSGNTADILGKPDGP